MRAMQSLAGFRFGRHTLILMSGYALWFLSLLVPSGLGSGIRGMGVWTLPMLLSFGLGSLKGGTLSGVVSGVLLLLALACNVLIFVRLPRWFAWVMLVLPLLPFLLLYGKVGTWAFQFYCFYPWIAGIWLIQLARLGVGAPPDSSRRL